MSTLRLFIVLVITLEARLVLRKYRPTIVAVTGSVGKTSTKDAIYTVLASAFFVRKSEKSFNSEIGIPLTILGCPNGWNNPLVWLRTIAEGLLLILLPNHYPKVLVLEVGADRPGDIRTISTWVKPDIAVMTLLPAVPVHVEFFKTPEALAAEKAHLIAATKAWGTAVMSFDDERVRGIALPTGVKKITFGCLEGADFLANEYQIMYENGKPTGIAFQIMHAGGSVEVALQGVLGRQHLYPALAAVAVGMTKGLSLKDAAEPLGKHQPPPGRMRLIEGKENSIIIDDSYNSSPAAAEQALEALGSVETQGRKVAIMGDMLELGSFSTEEHRRMGVLTAKYADILWTVGPRAKAMGEVAVEADLPKNKTRHFENSRAAAEAFEIESGDVILVKGSQSTRMERIVEGLMANPLEKEKLLVRQEPEWKDR